MARLNTSLKYIILCLGIVFLVSILMMGLLTSEDAEIEAYQKFLEKSERNRQRRENENESARRQREKGKELNIMNPAEPETVHEKPLDWGVQFISGKEMVKVVEGEHKSIQIHQVTIENLVDIDALVQCRDSFSKFSHIIPPSQSYDFSVTDIFHKRHYWCAVHFGKLTYNFLAYGEGAPRDNNHIMLKIDGAFINGKDMRKHDTTQKTKL